ncbi:MAG: MBL fold metallo-hydrolase [Halolamina sp.]
MTDRSRLHLDAFSVPVETRAPTGATNAYLLGRRNALLVDPAARTDTLDTVVAARDVGHVAVTHTHPDHVGAVADYAAETDAVVWARRPDRFRSVTGVDPDRCLAEGTTIPTGEGPVTALDVPGHAPDHVAFELPDGAVVCGDVAVAEGSVVVGADDGDLRGYLTALRRLYARDPPRLHPGHGPRIDDPQAACRRLLAHRMDRERRVRAAVEDRADGDPVAVETVVDAAYEKDLSGVTDLARATVRAHLEKLDREREVAYDRETERVSPV